MRAISVATSESALPARPRLGKKDLHFVKSTGAPLRIIVKIKAAICAGLIVERHPLGSCQIAGKLNQIVAGLPSLVGAVRATLIHSSRLKLPA